MCVCEDVVWRRGVMWDLDLERSLGVKSDIITPGCKVNGCYY